MSMWLVASLAGYFIAFIMYLENVFSVGVRKRETLVVVTVLCTISTVILGFIIGRIVEMACAIFLAYLYWSFNIGEMILGDV